MPSPFDYATEPVPSFPGVAVDDVIRSYVNLNKTLPLEEEDTIIVGLKLSPLVDIHDLKVEAGVSGTETDDFNDHIGSQIGYRKIIPALVHSDPLIYDFTNIAAIIFGQPDESPGTRFGGAAFGPDDNNSRVTISHDTFLKPTDFVSIPFWIYFDSAPGSTGYVTRFGSDATEPYRISLSNTGELIITFELTGGAVILSAGILSVGWHHIVAAAKSGEQKLFVNKIETDNDSVVGTLKTAATDLGIFNHPAGGSHLGEDNGISWLSIIHGYVPDVSNWIDNDFEGIRDVSTLEELLCLPFTNDERPQSPMTSGLFFSG